MREGASGRQRSRDRRVFVWPSPLSDHPRTAIYEAAVRGVLIVLTAIHLLLVAVSSPTLSRSTVGLGVVLLVSLALVARRSSRYAGMALLLVGLCLTPLVEFPNSSNLLSIVVGLAFAVFVSQLRTVPSLVGILGWFTCFVIVYLSSPHASDLATLIDHGVINLGAMMAVSLVQNMLIRKLVELDRVRSEAFELEVADHLRRNAVQARESARRVLHDQVLFVLVRMADSGDWEADTVRRSIDSFQHPWVRAGMDDSTDLVELLHAVIPAGTEVDVAPEHALARVDSRTATAVVRAVGEVLRNALRHGQAPARLQVLVEDDRCELTVTNSSPGTGDLRPGWGWRNSVEREVESIGGVASLRRDDGNVVAVLTWPVRPHGPDTEDRGPVRLSPHEVTTLTWAAWPAMLAHTLIALHHTPPPQWLIQVAVIVVLWLALWRLTTVLRSRQLSGPHLLALGGTAAVCVSVSLLVAGADSLMSYSSWSLGLASIPLCLAAFFSDVRRVGLLTICLVAPAVVILALHPEVTWASGSGALLTGVIPGLGHAFGRILRRVQVAADRDEAAVRERLTAISDRWSEGQANDLLSFARRSVIPFLERTLESSGVDRERARRLALQMRDELNAPGLLDGALRERLATARGRGADVVIHPIVDPHPDHSAVLLRALDRLLDDARTPDRVNVHINPAPQASSISLVAPTANARMKVISTILGSAPARLERDDFATTLVLEPSPDRGMDSTTPVG